MTPLDSYKNANWASNTASSICLASLQVNTLVFPARPQAEELHFFFLSIYPKPGSQLTQGGNRRAASSMHFSLNLWVSSWEKDEEKRVHWGAPFPHYSNLERTLTHAVTSGSVGQARALEERRDRLLSWPSRLSFQLRGLSPSSTKYRSTNIRALRGLDRQDVVGDVVGSLHPPHLLPLLLAGPLRPESWPPLSPDRSPGT